MLRQKYQRLPSMIQTIGVLLLCLCLSWVLVACGDRLESNSIAAIEPPREPVINGKLSEVAPPTVIQELRETLEQYHPQVKILSPKPDQILADTAVSVQLQVQDLPIFKNADLGLGPHLHLFLDDQPYRAVYDTEQPLILEDLAPGTHTLRVFASRPWHESFKNEGAFAQTTFHVLTRTADNAPESGEPLLTYSRPQGNYGAEPIMLDYYLTNAPLHLLAQENADDEISDWRIRATINGQSFLLDRWQPIYLKGFETGSNWIKLEFLDQQGNPIDNAFNSTVRVINYAPRGKDSLAKLVRGELSADQARGIVDPDFEITTTPTPVPTPAIQPTPPTETENQLPPPTETEDQPIVEEDLSPTVEEEEMPEAIESTEINAPEFDQGDTLEPSVTPPVIENSSTSPVVPVEPESISSENNPISVEPVIPSAEPTPIKTPTLTEPSLVAPSLNPTTSDASDSLSQSEKPSPKSVMLSPSQNSPAPKIE